MVLQPTDKAKTVGLTLTDEVGGYLNNTSVNTETRDRIHAELVPKKGYAKTVHGILIQGASRVYYDLYNNGGGNIINNIHDDELEEGEEDWHKPEYELDPYYQHFFDAFEKWLPKAHQPCVAEVKKLVLGDTTIYDIAFDHLIDRVVHTILTTKNVELT